MPETIEEEVGAENLDNTSEWLLGRFNNLRPPSRTEPGFSRDSDPATSPLTEVYRFVAEQKFGIDLLKTAGSRFRARVVHVYRADGILSGEAQVGVAPPPQARSLLKKADVNTTFSYALGVAIELFSDFIPISKKPKLTMFDVAKDGLPGVSLFPRAYPIKNDLPEPSIGDFIWVSRITDDDLTNFAYEEFISHEIPNALVLPIETGPEARFDPCEGELGIATVLSFDLGLPLPASCGDLSGETISALTQDDSSSALGNFLIPTSEQLFDQAPQGIFKL